MRTAANIVQGENGENKLATSGSPRVDAFTLLLQTSMDTTVRESINSIVREAEEAACCVGHLCQRGYRGEAAAEAATEAADIIEDLFVLAFHKRGTSKKNRDGELISDGEGFRKLFYIYILELYNLYPKAVISLAKSGIFSLYGYWKDYLNIWAMINEMGMTDMERYTKYNDLIVVFRKAILTQRSWDTKALRQYCTEHEFNYRDFSEQNNKAFTNVFIPAMAADKGPGGLNNLELSYVGKFCVRESSSVNNSCFWYTSSETSLERESHISYMLRYLLYRNVDGVKIPFPDNKSVPFGAKKAWRQENARLNIVLDVPEVKFCSGRWSDLDIVKIPSVCLHRNTKGLLNEQRKQIPEGDDEDVTGNRYPELQDRVDCRTHFIYHTVNGGKINASALLPNQIIGDITSPISTTNKMINQAKWDELLKITREKMESAKTDASSASSLAAGRILCCCDTSSSMTFVNKSPNRPIDVAIALTAFCSQLAAKPYRDLVMTFDAKPSILNLEKYTSYYERAQAINASAWAMNTNYAALHETLLHLCVSNKVPTEELPVLVIFTDGEFDTMVTFNGRSFDTAHDKVVQMWLAAGYPAPPTICYWNLAAERNGVQAQSSRRGVFFLQGPSPSNIKYVIYGEEANMDDESDDASDDAASAVTPMMIFRKAMDQPYFNPIRDILRKSFKA